MIRVASYGMGNVESVLNALAAIGAKAAPAERPADLADADRLVIPGVGAFGEAMRRLTDLGFLPALERLVLTEKKPALGICLGMELFADVSFEFGEHKGLGWIPGRVEAIPDRGGALRLPHVGWNDVHVRVREPFFAGLDADAACYFVHGYHFRAADPRHVLATVDYGRELVAAVGRDNILGLQFHPEKSQDAGLAILAAFAKWDGTAPC